MEHQAKGFATSVGLQTPNLQQHPPGQTYVSFFVYFFPPFFESINCQKKGHTYIAIIRWAVALEE